MVSSRRTAGRRSFDRHAGHGSRRGRGRFGWVVAWTCGPSYAGAADCSWKHRAAWPEQAADRRPITVASSGPANCGRWEIRGVRPPLRTGRLWRGRSSRLSSLRREERLDPGIQVGELEMLREGILLQELALHHSAEGRFAAPPG